MVSSFIVIYVVYYIKAVAKHSSLLYDQGLLTSGLVLHHQNVINLFLFLSPTFTENFIKIC